MIIFRLYGLLKREKKNTGRGLGKKGVKFKQAK